jgi:hypothetical protein
MAYLHLQHGLPMINDVVRNTFYKNILQETKNKTCLEIGFGSGILSILALEAGASRIIAYEEDSETYALGQEVIQSLQLQDNIELINERFQADKISRHNVDCIFTETINHTLFGESMLDSVNGNLPKILPNNYFLEVYAVPISLNYARRLINNDTSICNPGIEITTLFSTTINKILNKKETPIEDGLYGVDIKDIHQLLDLHNLKNPVKSYNIDINKKVMLNGVDWSIELEKGLNYVIVCRTGMSYKQHKLYTDICDNWGPFAQYGLIINANNNFTLKQNFQDGNVVFSYNDQEIHLIKDETAHNYNILETKKIKVVNFDH